MLRRLINWLLVKFRLRKKPPLKDTLEILQELLPLLYGMMVIVHAVKLLGISLHAPWYRRWWRSLKYRCRYLRFAVIGY